MSVTVSPKFQVVIPKHYREAMGIKAGQKVEWIPMGRSLQLVPVIPAKKLYGFAKGVSTRNIRDEDDRL